MSQVRVVIPYLDGIRGIAAFLVFVHHFILAFYPAVYTLDAGAMHTGWEVPIGQSVLSVFANGRYCVHIFFVLSGFVLSRGYFHSNDFTQLVSALHRRFIRLYIPVAFTLILSFTLMQAGLYLNRPVSTITHSEWWFGGFWIMENPFQQLLTCLAYSTLLHGDSIFNTCLWTMSAEFLGSLFVYAFLVFTHFTRYRPFMLLLATIYFCSIHHTLYVCFVLGISLCYLEQLRPAIRYPGTIAALLLALAFFFGSYPSCGNRAGTIFQHLGHTLLAYSGWYNTVAAYFLVAAFVIWQPLQRIAGSPVCSFLGRVSFSLYLLHMLVIGSFTSWLFLQLHTLLGYNYAVLVAFISTVPILLLSSWLMTRYIDEPGVSLARRTYHYIARQKPEFKANKIL